MRDRLQLTGSDRASDVRLQRAAVTHAPAAAPPSVQDVLQTPGQALDAATRRALEPRFGHDFSRVRVHSDPQAAASAEATGAHAYTVGQSIVFGAGQYQPGTSAGQRLLTHELTHVVQQGQGRAAGIQRQSPIDEDDPLEREADDMGRGIDGRGPGRTVPRPYREAARGLPAPPAAGLQSAEAPVLTKDRARFDSLRSFVTALPPRIRALVATGNPSEPWLREDNSNLQSVLRVLDQLVADLEAERLVVRFEQPTSENVGASYDYINNRMLLRPFSARSELAGIAIDLVHEYTHVLQDSAAEVAFAEQRPPQVGSREQELQNEIGARREQVYFSDLLALLGYSRSLTTDFDVMVNDKIFHGRFEQERNAATPEERAAATGEIRAEIEKHYKTQIERNGSFKTYTVELNPQNHALLHWDLPGRPTPVDLGELPASLASTEQLQPYVWRLIKALPDYKDLFTSAPGQRYGALNFFIVYRDRKITEFGINAPAE